MYKSFYKLTRKPFETIPDTSFLWLGENHQEALSTLHYGILDNKGFLLLTGEKGTGKTSLISGLTKSFDKDVEWAVISNPKLERIDFYNEIARNFGIDKQFTSKVQFLIQFSHFLHKVDDEKRKVLLLIDECHLLSQEMLEELRLLSNIEKADAKLINIFFVGEPSFNDLISQPKNRAVRQRLALTYNLQPLSLNETEDYIRHRLSAAGSEEKIFSAKAVQTVHTFSGGIPLEINKICDASLKIGAEREEGVVTPAIVEAASGKMDVSSPVAPEPEAEKVSQPRMAPVESQPQFQLGDDPDSKITGFNLEEDKRGGWLKLGVAALALVAVVGYFFRPGEEVAVAPPVQTSSPEIVQQETPPVPTTLPGSTSPAVSVLEESSDDINLDKAKELKTAILEKAYEEAETAAEPVQQVSPEPEVAGAATEPVAEKEADVEVASEVAAEEMQAEAASVVVAAVTPATPVRPVESVVEDEVAVTAAAEDVVQKAGAAESEVALIAAPQRKVVVAVDPSMVPLEPRKVVLPLMPGSLELTRTGKLALAGFVKQLKDHPKATVLVKGFVSSNNDTAENMKLSEDRALSVYKKLMKAGVDPEQVEVLGMGIKEPIASNDTREGRTKNRRVEIVVISDGV